MKYAEICSAYGDGTLPVSVIDDIELGTGGGNREGGSHVCMMQMVAWLGGERNTERPSCASRVLGEFCIELNDSGGDDMRRALRSRGPAMLGTANAMLEPSRLKALFLAVGTNLGELLMEITEPDLRVVAAPIVERYNAALVKDSVYEVMVAIGQIKKPAIGDNLVMSPFGYLCYIIDDLNHACEYESVELASSWLAGIFRRFDYHFGTRWDNLKPFDPRKPTPGARALAALDKAIAVDSLI